MRRRPRPTRRSGPIHRRRLTRRRRAAYGASYAPPYLPLGNPPQWRQPDPPPKMSRQELEQQREIEGDIVAFCDAHPDEQFCGKLGAWLRAHPQGAPR